MQQHCAATKAHPEAMPAANPTDGLCFFDPCPPPPDSFASSAAMPGSIPVADEAIFGPPDVVSSHSMIASALCKRSLRN